MMAFKSKPVKNKSKVSNCSTLKLKSVTASKGHVFHDAMFCEGTCQYVDFTDMLYRSI